MDDLGGKLQELLGSPDTIKKLQAAMAALGGGNPPAEEDTATREDPDTEAAPAIGGLPDLGGLGTLLKSMMGGGSSKGAADADRSGGSTAPELGLLLKAAPLLASFNQEDENTRLLHALRPYLHGEREKRLDGAISILRLSKLLPLIQDSGLF